jgi:hypothetical protein
MLEIGALSDVSCMNHPLRCCSAVNCALIQPHPSPGGKRLAPLSPFHRRCLGGLLFPVGGIAASMIDRIYFTLPPGTLDNCPFLLFQQTVEATGELCKWRVAKWGAFEIKVNNYSGRIEVKGSLHKYWSKSHNGGPFPRWAVAQAVQNLAAELKFNPVQGELHGFEFGANVPMPTPAKGLLCRMILHSGKGCPPKVPTSSHNRRGLMREVEAQQYYVKGYDKEAQLDDSSDDTTGGEALRFEVKVCTMQQLKQAGVRTLADLAHPAKLEAMGKLLFRHWDSLLFAAPGELPATLRTADRQLLERAARVGYWEGLPVPQLRVQVKRYRKVYAQCVVDEAFNAATQGLRSTWQQLLTQPEPVAAVATIAELPASQLNPLCKVLSFQGREQAAPPLVDDAGVGGLRAQPRPPACLAADDERGQPTTATRCCQTCGRALTSSSSRAKFCSEQVWGAAAKKCRNADSNPRNNAKRGRFYPSPAQYYLFDMVPFSKAAA